MRTKLTAILILACLMAQAQYIITPRSGADPLQLNGLKSDTCTMVLTVTPDGVVKKNPNLFVESSKMVYVFGCDLKHEGDYFTANGHADEQGRPGTWIETKHYIPDAGKIKRVFWVCESFTDNPPPNIAIKAGSTTQVVSLTGYTGEIYFNVLPFNVTPGILQVFHWDYSMTDKTLFYVEVE